MISDKIGRELHHRKTMDEKLSVQEELQLNNWYAYHDAQETIILNSPTPSLSIDDLQLKIQEALQQLTLMSQRSEKMLLENSEIRAENKVLQRLAFKD